MGQPANCSASAEGLAVGKLLCVLRRVLHPRPPSHHPLYPAVSSEDGNRPDPRLPPGPPEGLPLILSFFHSTNAGVESTFPGPGSAGKEAESKTESLPHRAPVLGRGRQAAKEYRILITKNWLSTQQICTVVDAYTHLDASSWQLPESSRVAQQQSPL